MFAYSLAPHLPLCNIRDITPFDRCCKWCVRIPATCLRAAKFQVREELKRKVGVLNAAASGQKLVEFGYTRRDGQESYRRVRPLGLYFRDGAWTLANWCETRNDFCNFRVDRMSGLCVFDQRFPSDNDKSLEAFINSMRQESSSVSDASRGPNTS